LGPLRGPLFFAQFCELCLVQIAYRT